jgi:plasmid stability protein
VRTTISISDDLLREAKERAARTGRTLGSVVEEALRLMLAAAREQPASVVLPTDPGDGRGLAPGADLDDSAALYELMDADAAV